MTSLCHIVAKAAVLLGLILMGLAPAGSPLPLLSPRPALLASDERAGEGLVLLTSYHEGYRWNDDVVEEVTYYYLESGAARDSLLVEYVDALRLSEADGQRRLYQRLKDRGMPANGSLILADDPAMAFYLRYREQLDWPDQVVAMGLNDDRLRLEAKAVQVRILTSYPVMAQSLRLLLEAFGAPLRIIILGDDSDHGRNVIDDLSEVIGTLDEVELVDVLAGWRPEDVIGRLASAPDNTRLYLQGGQDSGWGSGAGSTESRIRRLAEADIPVFCHFEFQMAIGCAGGAILDVEFLAHAAVEMALSPAFELVPERSSVMAQRRQINVRWYELFASEIDLPFEWVGIRGRFDELAGEYRTSVGVLVAVAGLSIVSSLYLLLSRYLTRRRRRTLMVDASYQLPTRLALETSQLSKLCGSVGWMFLLVSPQLKLYRSSFKAVSLEWLFGINIDALRHHLPAGWLLYLGDEKQLIGVVPVCARPLDIESCIDSCISQVSVTQRRASAQLLRWHAVLVKVPDHTVDAKACLSALDEGAQRLEREGWIRPTLTVVAVEPYHDTRFRWLSRQVGALIDHPEQQWRLVVQPKVSPLNERLLGVEVLARWHHPEAGDISPQEFIPVLLMLALAERFDRWVIQASLDWFAANSRDWLRSLAVNVHLSTLLADDFRDFVVAELDLRGLPHYCLELELVEHEHFDDVERLRMQLAALRDSGIAVALDDFGTGHTAFQLLQRLPLKAVKLDHSLLHAARHMSQARQAYAALVAMCLRLGFTVVAEGVETIEDARWLITLGIQQGQGYFFARPMELRDFVRRYRPGQRAGGGEFDVGAADYPAEGSWRRQVENE